MTAYSTQALVPGTQFTGVDLSATFEGGKLSEEVKDYFRDQWKECPKADVENFFRICEIYRLNPQGQAQIFGVPRTENVRDDNDRWVSRKRLVSQIGINGLTLIAERTGRFGGVTEPVWCGEDGIWRPFWNKHTTEQVQRGKAMMTVHVPLAPEAAKVGVGVKGMDRPSYQTANWFESADFDFEGKPRNLWASKPALMLAKTATALALRRTFQQEFAELRTVEFNPALGDGAGGGRVTVSGGRIEDLYPDTPDTTRRVYGGASPQLSAPEAPADFIDTTARDAAPVTPKSEPPARPAPAASRQGKDPDGATTFYSRARELGFDLPRDWSDVFGVPTLLAWLNADKSRTWESATGMLNVSTGLEADGSPKPVDAEPEIEGFDDAGNPIVAQQQPLMSQHDALRNLTARGNH